MNDLLFLQNLRDVLKGGSYSTLAGSLIPAATEEVPDPTPNIFCSQDAANTSRPILILHCPQGYQTYGIRRKGTIALELRSRQADDTAESLHQARWVNLWTAFFGVKGTTPEDTAANQAAAKAALISAISALMGTTLIDYGPPDNAVMAGVAGDAGDDLQTVLQLRVAWFFQ